VNNLFKDMLAEHFEQEIYDFLQDHIMNNYDQEGHGDRFLVPPYNGNEEN
jgi:hypothetical protein